jgi:hypothetical protein
LFCEEEARLWIGVAVVVGLGLALVLRGEVEEDGGVDLASAIVLVADVFEFGSVSESEVVGGVRLLDDAALRSKSEAEIDLFSRVALMISKKQGM